jgi:hypothetical protein
MLLELAIALTFFILILTISYALKVLGLFHIVEVSTGCPPIDINGKEVAYKLARGNYSKSGPMFTEMIGDFGKIDNDVIFTTIGFFYDDPDVTEEHKCRYAVGCIVPKEHQEKFKPRLEEMGYMFMNMPNVDHVVHSNFPYVGAISIWIAVRRVYPAIKRYISEHNLCAHPCLEVYHEDKITFILPLSKQDHFYLFEDEEDEADDEESTEECSASGSEHESGSEREYPSHSQSEQRSRTASLEEPVAATSQTSPLSTSRKNSTSSSFEELSATEASGTHD